MRFRHDGQAERCLGQAAIHRGVGCVLCPDQLRPTDTEGFVPFWQNSLVLSPATVAFLAVASCHLHEAACKRVFSREGFVLQIESGPLGRVSRQSGVIGYL